MQTTPVTSANALFTFYDIESLANIFTVAAYTPRTNHVDLFYLLDEHPDPNHELNNALSNAGGGPSASALATIADWLAFRNPSWPTENRSFMLYDLATKEGAYALARLIGLSNAEYVNNPKSESNYPSQLRPVCDTDDEYDPINTHPFLVGYNSYNYDTTMLAVLMMELFNSTWDGGEFNTTLTASAMRAHNDQLFTEDYVKQMTRYLTQGPVAKGERWNSNVNLIRNAMIRSGRHVDAARLNESSVMVALKRLLGGMGRQVLESDKLGPHSNTVDNFTEVCELFAYNVSDVIGLSQLFADYRYAGSFDLRVGLMAEYPETIYGRAKNSFPHAPYEVKHNVRRDRLTPDSTSAKFVSFILSPYGVLDDIETVSFLYPSEEIAQELGIKRVDVLEETKTFFYENIKDPEARASFDVVYNYYKSIAGKNFNGSEHYRELYPHQGIHDIKEIPKAATTIPYFFADGTPSSCYANFSVGGIHGAEANLALYEMDKALYQESLETWEYARGLGMTPAQLIELSKLQANSITLPDGSTVDRRVVLTSPNPLTANYRKPVAKAVQADPAGLDMLTRAQSQVPDPKDLLARLDTTRESNVVTLPGGVTTKLTNILDGVTPAKATFLSAPKMKAPRLFETASGENKTPKRYTFTSADVAIHEDFTSYYPNLLRNMRAFFNKDLGTDRYAKIFFDKENYGKLLKDPSTSKEDRIRYGVMREGTKLILNAASGAGDASFDNNIRMNNQIISMRLLGQLFSWRIGQAQTLHGARIISTNTDGLYSVLDEETNNRVLAEQAAIINVDIEPETLLVVSNNSNSRLEMHLPEPGQPLWSAEIIGASGGQLGNYKGPGMKSLAHPAISDNVLASYLRYIVTGYIPEHRTTPLSINEPFDLKVGMDLLVEATKLEDKVLVLRLFQNIVVASRGAITYPFTTDALPTPLLDANGNPVASTENPKNIQHANRVFIVKQGTVGAVHLQAASADIINVKTAAAREAQRVKAHQTDPTALKILQAEGLTRQIRVGQVGYRLIPENRDVKIRRINGIDPGWSIVIVNSDLHTRPPAMLDALIERLDLQAYLSTIANSYADNWLNEPMVEPEGNNIEIDLPWDE